MNLRFLCPLENFNILEIEVSTGIHIPQALNGPCNVHAGTLMQVA